MPAAIMENSKRASSTPMMFNIILEQVPDERLGFMIGIASLITAMAPAVGPSLGGMIVSYFGWRMIFVSLLPFLLLSAILGIKNIRQAGKLEQTSFNFGLYLLLIIGFSSLIFATSIATTITNSHFHINFSTLN